MEELLSPEVLLLLIRFVQELSFIYCIQDHMRIMLNDFGREITEDCVAFLRDAAIRACLWSLAFVHDSLIELDQEGNMGNDFIIKI